MEKQVKCRALRDFTIIDDSRCRISVTGLRRGLWTDKMIMMQPLKFIDFKKGEIVIGILGEGCIRIFDCEVPFVSMFGKENIEIKEELPRIPFLVTDKKQK